MTDAQWAILQPLLPPAPGGGRPRTTDLREVLNAILHLLRTGKLELEQVERALENESGLLGLSGTSARVEELERSDDPQSQLALAVFGYRIAGSVASIAVALGGLDALVFTAGVGERSAPGDLLRFAPLKGATEAVARHISPKDALDNLQVLEQTQRLLHTNVQEALALEVGLLKLKL